MDFVRSIAKPVIQTCQQYHVHEVAFGTGVVSVCGWLYKGRSLPGKVQAGIAITSASLILFALATRVEPKEETEGDDSVPTLNWRENLSSFTTTCRGYHLDKGMALVGLLGLGTCIFRRRTLSAGRQVCLLTPSIILLAMGVGCRSAGPSGAGGSSDSPHVSEIINPRTDLRDSDSWYRQQSIKKFTPVEIPEDRPSEFTLDTTVEDKPAWDVAKILVAALKEQLEVKKRKNEHVKERNVRMAREATDQSDPPPTPCRTYDDPSVSITDVRNLTLSYGNLTGLVAHSNEFATFVTGLPFREVLEALVSMKVILGWEIEDQRLAGGKVLHIQLGKSPDQSE